MELVVMTIFICEYGHGRVTFELLWLSPLCGIAQFLVLSLPKLFYLYYKQGGMLI